MEFCRRSHKEHHSDRQLIVSSRRSTSHKRRGGVRPVNTSRYARESQAHLCRLIDSSQRSVLPVQRHSDRQLIDSSRRSTITQEAGRGTAGQHVTVCPRVPSAPVQTDRFIAAFFLSSWFTSKEFARRYLSLPPTVLIGRFSRSIFSEIRFSSLAPK